MTPIKFRAFYEGKMIPVGTLEFFTDGQITVNEELVGAKIMQWTGLKDCNGVEIYEGDILNVNGESARVYYDENNVCFSLDTDSDYNPCIGRYNVIGNVWEHPHLLANKEQQL